MLFAQIVTGGSPGLVTVEPDLLGKICAVILYLKSSTLATIAIGSALGFLAGTCRLLINIFKYRWAFLAALITLIIAVLGSWGVAVKCLHFAGELGDRTDYWGQAVFVVFAIFPGILSIIGGVKASWEMPSDAIPSLNRFVALLALAGIYIFGISLGYGICNSYIFLITVWPSWAVVLTLPFFLITPAFVPILQGILTGDWDLLWATWIPIGLGLGLMLLERTKNKNGLH